MGRLLARSILLVLFIFGTGTSEECSSGPVGLRDANGIPYYYLQATSYSNGCFQKEINKEGQMWCPTQGKEADSYLEADLGDRFSLCAVSTQGAASGHVTKYKLLMSSDRINWLPYMENNTEKIFSGNNDAGSVVKHNFTSSQTARFVRFYPMKYASAPCILVELYGLMIPRETCEKSSLLENNTYLSITTSGPEIKKLSASDLWCLNSNAANPGNASQHLQIDIGSPSVVCAVNVLDNSSSSNIMAKSYEVEYSIDGKRWTGYQENKIPKKFKTAGVSILLERILCRYLRLTSFKNITCFKMEVYGFSQQELLSEDVGIKYEQNLSKIKYPDQTLPRIPNMFDSGYPQKNGRLYKPKSSWCSEVDGSYIEIVLVDEFLVFAVSVQGFWLNFKEFVSAKNYKIEYSTNYQNWSGYSILNGAQWINVSNVVSVHALTSPIKARIFRLFVHGDEMKCLKLELHGIPATYSGLCSRMYPLGLSYEGPKSTLEEQNITGLSASSEYFGKAKDARLREIHGAWRARSSDSAPFLKVTFKDLIVIGGIATQGYKRDRVTHYQISYSYDEKSWYYYMGLETTSKRFTGNNVSGEDAIFANWFNPPVVTRHIRINVLQHFGKVRLRLELYGCRDGDIRPDLESGIEKHTLNRTINTTVSLSCTVRGQAGMIVTWAQNRRTIQRSLVPFNRTAGVFNSNLLVTYYSDEQIWENFSCLESNISSREQLCSAVYTCSAAYPTATAEALQKITVDVTPNINSNVTVAARHQLTIRVSALSLLSVSGEASFATMLQLRWYTALVDFFRAHELWFNKRFKFCSYLTFKA